MTILISFHKNPVFSWLHSNCVSKDLSLKGGISMGAKLLTLGKFLLPKILAGVKHATKFAVKAIIKVGKLIPVAGQKAFSVTLKATNSRKIATAAKQVATIGMFVAGDKAITSVSSFIPEGKVKKSAELAARMALVNALSMKGEEDHAKKQ